MLNDLLAFWEIVKKEVKIKFHWGFFLGLSVVDGLFGLTVLGDEMRFGMGLRLNEGEFGEFLIEFWG